MIWALYSITRLFWAWANHDISCLLLFWHEISTKVEMAIDQHTKQLAICFCFFNSVGLCNSAFVNHRQRFFGWNVQHLGFLIRWASSYFQWTIYSSCLWIIFWEVIFLLSTLSILSGKNDVVSSAYLTANPSLNCSQSTKACQRVGPINVPCGTPTSHEVICDHTPWGFRYTHCVRSSR